MSEITKIEVQKRNKNRVNIFIDNEYALSVNSEIVYKENLKKGKIIDKENLFLLAKEDNYIKCKETALKIVERSYKTEKQMAEKLKEKGYNIDEIKRTLAFLKEYKFIDNNKIGKMYVTDKSKKYGEKKIRYDLLNKGFTEEEINKSLEIVDRDTEKQVAKELGIKKYNSLIKREKDIYKLKNKLYTYLAGRGFDYSIIKEVEVEIINNI
ncbi:MAG: recombination regulator RecX [Clostridiales bacterium]|nr:recombination regulator RecX [Clostridiales bacterium]